MPGEVEEEAEEEDVEEEEVVAVASVVGAEVAEDSRATCFRGEGRTYLSLLKHSNGCF